jgi:hypothetical protein
MLLATTDQSNRVNLSQRANDGGEMTRWVMSCRNQNAASTLPPKAAATIADRSGS